MNPIQKPLQNIDVDSYSDREYQCDICFKFYATLTNLKKHEKLHYIKEEFLPEKTKIEEIHQCDICFRIYPLISGLKNHKKIHLFENFGKIGKVSPGESSPKRSSPGESLLRESSPKRYSCEVCFRSYSLKRNLKRHQKIHNSKEEKINPQKEPIQPVKLISEKYEGIYKGVIQIPIFKSQPLQISEDEPTLYGFYCSNCSYSGKNSDDIERHVKIHNSKNSSTSSELESKQTFYGEKPYICKYCIFSAKSAYILKLHTRIHTGEKPYKCEYCDFTCARADSLKNHILSHTRIRKCKYCEYTTINKDDFKIHIRTHVKEKPYRCPYCVNCYTTFTKLKKHQVMCQNKSSEDGNVIHFNNIVGYDNIIEVNNDTNSEVSINHITIPDYLFQNDILFFD